MNAVHLTGRLTRDPELRSRSNGESVCAMRLAVDGPRDGSTTFIDVAAFDRLADNCGEYLSQGRAVAVSGRLAYSEWKADDGSKRSKHEVVASQVDFLASAKPEPERAEAAS